MKKKITRRDFLNGAAIAIAAGGTLSPSTLLALEQAKQSASPTGPGKDYYPPTLTGIRGSHKGSFEVSHQLAWANQKPDHYQPLNEEYDLIVVGAGISGLAAAYFYRQQHGADKKILIVDNHDDFGGHAKRNEFQHGDRTLLGVGGSVNLEAYAFSDTVNRVLEELGVDLDKLNAARDPNYILSNFNADSGYFLNKKYFGQNKIVQGNWAKLWSGDEQALELLNELGLPAEQQQRLRDLITGEKDLLDDLSLLETIDYIAATSYEKFLVSRAGLTQETLMLFEPFNKILMGVGTDSVSVEEGILLGYPGANSVGYTGQLANTLLNYAKEDLRFPIFPDGNASIARLLVRKLIPEVAPGNTMEDIIDARFDYSQLDRSGSAVRIRLNSTAVNVKNVNGGVEMSYVQNGKPSTLKGKHSILACYNGLIPHLCPELPENQKENLQYGVKVPLVMTNVLLRSGKTVNASGPAQYHCPGSYFAVVSKAPPVNLGNYQDNSEGSNPLVLWMCHAPAPRNNGEQNTRDLFRLGRHSLYRTSFDTYEQEVKQQLTAMFGANGFDADRDIEAITVNRWSHGYAYSYSTLFDPDWEEGKTPHELGRAPIGRISIANSDSEASASVQAAIDTAERAVGELNQANKSKDSNTLSSKP
ncbi:NAD(P)-binding protein [Oceanicoccus sagamiensis]|uniref:Tat pathway signal sequence domain protein n=1 Tax=Oceanicoccus sagamiensis TaxID=716816 RepID=A0A1X9NB20_9GAMM|nr:FAD/NAD(P)-binding protein [Oceanicoccus sagamiensis]ARN73115.1 Tat pathway signal sequence domain protein [Oceanicoccus sagamiensis]